MILKIHHLAYKSFWKNFLRQYFTTSNIIKGFFASFLLSNFLLFEFFGIEIQLLSIILSFISLSILLSLDYKGFFWFGFFLSLFWFYWISFSFIFYGFWYLIPLGILFVSILYGIIFAFISCWIDNVYARAIGLFFVSFIQPFGFNWLDLRLILVNSPFEVGYFSLACFILSAAIFIDFKTKWKYLILILILSLNIDNANKEINLLPLDIELVSTDISQNKKWKSEFINTQTNTNFKKIKNAIENKKDLIILPESAFPKLLNKDTKLITTLKTLSKKISIVTGGLTYENNNFYNSTYIFENGKMQILHKFILVPFGEKIPLPEFLVKIINKLFYDGATDFSVANKPQSFYIKNIKIKNAICFEATREELFADNPEYMIAISNNAWFMPSSEAIFQNQLLKLYASLHNTTIYHSTNKSESQIITPKNGGFLGEVKELLLDFLDFDQ